MSRCGAHPNASRPRLVVIRREPGPPRSCRTRTRGGPDSAAVFLGSPARRDATACARSRSGSSSSATSRARRLGDACGPRASRARSARSRSRARRAARPRPGEPRVVHDAHGHGRRLRLARISAGARPARSSRCSSSLLGQVPARERAAGDAPGLARAQLGPHAPQGRTVELEPGREPGPHHDLVGHGAPRLSVDLERDPAGARARELRQRAASARLRGGCLGLRLGLGFGSAAFAAFDPFVAATSSSSGSSRADTTTPSVRAAPGRRARSRR